MHSQNFPSAGFGRFHSFLQMILNLFTWLYRYQNKKNLWNFASVCCCIPPAVSCVGMKRVLYGTKYLTCKSRLKSIFQFLVAFWFFLFFCFLFVRFLSHTGDSHEEAENSSYFWFYDLGKRFTAFSWESPEVIFS